MKTRKSKKSTLTNRAIELSFKKLDELTQNTIDNLKDEHKIKIVQQSIERGWIGFFALAIGKSCSNNQNTNWFAEIGKEEGIF